MRVIYVNRDHLHPLYRMGGVILVRSRGKGPKNCLARMDNGQLVVSSFWNFRKAR
ncbi:MAG: hypothetical protein P4N41_06405 [Negativicutes bacterium]|nr:hypothetical protein [Negativicutes bacterium]